ncbi:BMP family ABC transporter substrate-binding protein [Desulfobacter latus]|uniref:BMP family ABC transporter substrate-binding protein n=1 Tax=Desulfobacter latus TaxID=2292 RepID=A0A850TE30_9BACT|nr:BMP family ABC transporter substrate-binding protein [Desulfobacter latus]NWH06547.1 BMP family ABC transporter substrate-binding protein [Desulfobacter latus]
MKIKMSTLITGFVFLFAVFLAGCGEQEKPTQASKAPEKAAEQQEASTAEKRLKAGFIYVGPVGDYGWSHAHDLGKRHVESLYPWLETVIVESVAEADALRIMDRLVQQQKCDVIFTTSFGYMDNTVKAAEKYPDTKFMHCSGFKRTANLGTYFGDLYQMYYLNGMMAGALTQSNKLGYVAAFPIPELIRHINAYALGAKAVNPDATVDVKWIYAWYGPDKAKEAAEALIAEGCDALAFTEDTPAVVEVGQAHCKKGKQIYTFSHYSPMQAYGEDSVVSGQRMDWGGMYAEILKDVHEGTWDPSRDIWWLAKEKAAILGGSPDHAINPKFIAPLKQAMINTEQYGDISAYDLVMKRYEQMKQGVDVFDPFMGPVSDNKGESKIKEGERASKEDLLSMMYYVDNVKGEIPNSN